PERGRGSLVGVSRIDLFGDVVEPVERKTGDLYDFCLNSACLQIVDDGAEPVLSGHRRSLQRRSDEKRRRGRPDVTRAVVPEIVRLVEVAAGDKGDRTTFDRSSRRERGCGLTDQYPVSPSSGPSRNSGRWRNQAIRRPLASFMTGSSQSACSASSG